MAALPLAVWTTTASALLALPPHAGAALLQRVLAAAESGEHGDIAEVWLHVHTGNAAAQAFYEAQGFTRSPGEWKGYYRGVEPPDAFVYRRAGDCRGAGACAASASAAACRYRYRR